ncbi:MAG: 50S ribosomal protein L37ae [Methanosarcinales archaeon]
MTKKGKGGPAGRYGPRYGKMIRARVSKIEVEQRKRHLCPRCNMPYVKRVSCGIWRCKKCGLKFASLAYYPRKE